MNNTSIKFADLHTHTIYSDGIFTPTELIQYASTKNIAVISITDHDEILGIDEAIEAGKKYGIEVIPGIEFNTDFKENDLHILGYYIDYKNNKFKEKLTQLKNARIERMELMIKKLNDCGFKITFEDVYNEVLNDDKDNGYSIGRPHLARAMVKKKIVAEEKAAFENYIGNGKPCYVEVLNKLSPYDAIKLIIEFGGIPVMAHPGLTMRDDIISSLVEAGLVGLEVYHSAHNETSIEKYLKIANEFKLIITGGSDCHGPKNNSTPLCGTVQVPLNVVNNLKQKKGLI